MAAVTKNVVIVGGGLAGLACGVKLSSVPGFKVTLLEAADRVGGRVHSAKFGEGHVEMGANWIHGQKGNSIYSLAASFDLVEVPPENDFCSTYVTQRGDFLPDAVSKRVDELWDKIQINESSSIQDNESVGDYAGKIFRKVNEESPIHPLESVRAGILDWMHRYRNVIDGSHSWFVDSCKGQLDYTSCEGSPTVEWKKPACYNTLLQILIHGEPTAVDNSLQLPKWIHLKMEVESINYGGDDVKVQCKDGTKFDADYVVSTVSLGVLKHKHEQMFHPPLPKEKIQAIQQIGFGVVNKIFVEFGDAWWPQNSAHFALIWDDCQQVNENWLPDPSPSALLEEDDNGIPLWCRSILGFGTMINKPKVLVAWITGPPAAFMETLDRETLENHLMKVLHKFLGARFKVPKPIAILRTAWKSNTLTRGSYSFRTVSSVENDVSAAQLAMPICTPRNKPVICFAGEATHSNFYSTAHGAYDTGLREADRIIQHANNE